jgi:hypothetical protein
MTAHLKGKTLQQPSEQPLLLHQHRLLQQRQNPAPCCPVAAAVACQWHYGWPQLPKIHLQQMRTLG